MSGPQCGFFNFLVDDIHKMLPGFINLSDALLGDSLSIDSVEAFSAGGQLEVQVRRDSQINQRISISILYCIITFPTRLGGGD
ncbi:hypothetical protein PENANT_c008G10112 [Penicillium antarcticum]|uniref:Uncharacterized protein n=1 Tax=Penicillium antarcticum TaxID=416450 RepID=A0A1V6QAT4_9EURO|nr:hypothetical protein PENANT_c008G10112 [Penicillium antarcticum]